ncbi:aspartyl/asparaginyl beta-hydroxylase domain-containing protein [Streptomyces exfoliatus]|uniref:aspartyl/asparaginyl beta-hydroxylase domain-containing protein n=1 Tax=Streptomyces exfoliatus TaxID=1905 RepID=UPI003C2FDB03
MIKWLEVRIARHSKIGDTPFFPDSLFPWAANLEQHWRDMRRELDTLLEFRDSLPNFQDISSEQRSLSDDDQWKTYFFVGYGLEFGKSIGRCPRTAELLALVPGLTTAFFSILGPHKNLPEHRGPYKGVVRYHLALKIPAEERCGIKVGGQTAYWREGKSLFFDDTYPHEAWNDTDEDRVVLFVDVIRPLPFPYSVLNSLVLKSISRAPFVRNAASKHEAWEKLFEELRERRD